MTPKARSTADVFVWKKKSLSGYESCVIQEKAIRRCRQLSRGLNMLCPFTDTYWECCQAVRGDLLFFSTEFYHCCLTEGGSLKTFWTLHFLLRLYTNWAIGNWLLSWGCPEFIISREGWGDDEVGKCVCVCMWVCVEYSTSNRGLFSIIHSKCWPLTKHRIEAGNYFL